MPVFSRSLGSISANDPNAIRLLANHIRIMQEELEYRLTVLDSTNISEIDTDVTKIYSIEAEEQIVLSVGDINKKYTELKVAVDGVTITDETGTTRIKGSSIETGSLVLTGQITFSDLDSSTQNKINSAGGISAAEARTIITSTLVSSPTIAGAKFMNLDQTTWIEIGKDTNENNDAYGLVLTSNAHEPGGIFSVYNGDFGYTSLYGKLGYNFLTLVGDTATTYANGTWDFSAANVTGVTAAFA